MTHRGCISLGLPALPIVAAEAVRALRGRLLRRGGSLTADSVRQYFERRSRQGDRFHDVVASGSRPYRRLFDAAGLASTLKELPRNAPVLDFGCGSGSLSSYVLASAPHVRYIGYDFNSVEIELRSKSTPHRNITFTSSLDGLSAEVCLLINVLAYTSDVDLPLLGRQLVSATSPDAIVFIVEPAPRWYWEVDFDGISLQLRSVDQVHEVGRSWGLEVLTSTCGALINYRGRPIGAIVHSTSFSSKGGVDDRADAPS